MVVVRGAIDAWSDAASAEARVVDAEPHVDAICLRIHLAPHFATQAVVCLCACPAPTVPPQIQIDRCDRSILSNKEKAATQVYRRISVSFSSPPILLSPPPPPDVHCLTSLVIA